MMLGRFPKSKEEQAKCRHEWEKIESDCPKLESNGIEYTTWWQCTKCLDVTPHKPKLNNLEDFQ